MQPGIRTLLKTAARPYWAAGPYAYFFARGKLAGDPIFVATLRNGDIPTGARVLDLGCGQCLLAALLLAADRQFEAGIWPRDWPEPPRFSSWLGIDAHASSANAARTALGGNSISVLTADLRDAELPDADVVLLFDVLHYLEAEQQVILLEKVARALRGGGKLLLRVADAEAGWRFGLTRVIDHGVVVLSGRLSTRFFCRSIADWTGLLSRFGFRIERQPMSQGTPFANILLTARL